MNNLLILSEKEDITTLHFSVRSLNALKKSGINTIGELLKLSDEQIYKIKNIGAKSAQEIIETIKTLDIKRVELSSSEFTSAADSNLAYIQNRPTFEDEFGVIYYDALIEDSALSNRAKNSLLRVGIKKLSQIRKFTFDDFMSIKNMGSKTAQELVDIISSFCFEPKKEVNSSEFLDENIKFIISEIDQYLGIDKRIITLLISKLLEQQPQLYGESLIYKIYEQKEILYSFKKSVVDSIKRKTKLSKNVLISSLPKHLLNTTILEKTLLELEYDGTIIFEDDESLSFIYPTILEFAETLNEKEREILLKKISGKTLEEIGTDYGFTRERARQKLSGILKKRPQLAEDKYIYVFSTYDFTLEDFNFSFGTNNEVYYYLESICTVKNKDKKVIDDSLNDENISIEMKKRIEKCVFKNYINTGDRMIHKDRPSLVKYAASIFAKDKIKYDDFVDKYHLWLNDYGIYDDKYILASRAYENHLNACDYVLWNFGRSFRYYDIHAREYGDLFDELDLENYEDVELSTYKFFKEYSDLMQEYDIRDEFELHNLLKKSNHYSENIVFGKMPTIVIGNGDAEKQAFELLYNNSPINTNDFGILYEETYGIKKDTAIGGPFKALRQYYHEGIYTVDYERLSEDESEFIRNSLTDDFYTLSNVQKRYLSQFPDGDIKRINARSLMEIGFKAFSQYIIKGTYHNLSEYVQSLLLNKDFVDIDEITNGIQRTGTFTTELYKHRANYEIIEYMPKQYMNIKRLESVGIRKNDLIDYCNAVNEFISPGAYFTIHSLNKTMFEHSLHDLGFDDTFYAAILTEDRKHFSYFKAANNKVFFAGNKEVLLTDFLEYVFKDFDKIDIYDLQQLLQEEYGLHFSKENLAEHIKKSSLYYSVTTMDIVYRDYNTYLEEI